jgi:hypothetical protein
MPKRGILTKWGSSGIFVGATSNRAVTFPQEPKKVRIYLGSFPIAALQELLWVKHKKFLTL